MPISREALLSALVVSAFLRKVGVFPGDQGPVPFMIRAGQCQVVAVDPGRGKWEGSYVERPGLFPKPIPTVTKTQARSYHTSPGGHADERVDSNPHPDQEA